MNAASAPEATDGLRADFTLRRGAFALRASLSAPSGLTALLGPSGAGKSLTLQAIAGLVGIERGAIQLNGRTLADTQAGVALAPRLRRVGYVPQSYALFPHLSVGANIAYGLPRHLDRTAREKRVADLLRLARLPDYANRTPHDLSGGEAQRVALARALAAEPEALLLDEPFSALDAPTRAAVRDDLREVALASGLPTLLVTHDLSEALALASRLALIVSGRVITEGPTEEVTARPTTALTARLLGWGAILDVARVERRTDGVCAALAGCGQALLLTDDERADAAASPDAERVRLALRPERLRVAREESSGGAAPGVGRSLRGVIRSVTEAGPLWSAEVALRVDDEACATLPLPFSAREWQALGLTVGDPVTLSLAQGAARLVVEDGAYNAEAI